MKRINLTPQRILILAVTLVIITASVLFVSFFHRPARAFGTTKYAINAGGNWSAK